MFDLMGGSSDPLGRDGPRIFVEKQFAIKGRNLVTACFRAEPVLHKLLPPGNCRIMVADTRVLTINCTQNMHLMTAWNSFTLKVHARTEKNAIINNGYLSDP
jgi:hypothetical protein